METRIRTAGPDRLEISPHGGDERNMPRNTDIPEPGPRPNTRSALVYLLLLVVSLGLIALGAVLIATSKGTALPKVVLVVGCIVFLFSLFRIMALMTRGKKRVVIPGTGATRDDLNEAASARQERERWNAMTDEEREEEAVRVARQRLDAIFARVDMARATRAAAEEQQRLEQILSVPLGRMPTTPEERLAEFYRINPHRVANV